MPVVFTDVGGRVVAVHIRPDASHRHPAADLTAGYPHPVRWSPSGLHASTRRTTTSWAKTNLYQKVLAEKVEEVLTATHAALVDGKVNPLGVPVIDPGGN